MLKKKTQPVTTEEITPPTLEQAKHYIYAINFDQIIDKMVKHQGWTENNAKQTCALYRNFLYLNKKYACEYGQLPPSEDIDEFWHNHILDTQKYQQDCQLIFGTYFHHYPYLGIDGQSTMQDLDNFFETTQDLHYQEFGDYIYEVRSKVWKRLYTFVKLLFSGRKSPLRPQSGGRG